MTIPDKLKEQLVKHEGLRLRPYECTGRAKTIGVGHNIDAWGLPEMARYQLDVFGAITEDVAFGLLDEDVARATADCRKLYRDFDKFSETRQFALIDFVFQLGLTRARSFYNANRAINRGDWEAAAKAMENSLWYRQTYNRAKTVVEMVRNG